MVIRSQESFWHRTTVVLRLFDIRLASLVYKIIWAAFDVPSYLIIVLESIVVWRSLCPVAVYGADREQNNTRK